MFFFFVLSLFFNVKKRHFLGFDDVFFFVLSLFFNVKKRHFLGFNDVFFLFYHCFLMLRNDTFWDSMMFFVCFIIVF